MFGRHFCKAALVICVVAGQAVAGEGLRWQDNLESAQELAAKSNRLLLVHFGAPWCEPCQRLEKNVFAQPGFGESLNAGFVAVKLNRDLYPGTARHFGVDRLPMDVIVSPEGEVIGKFVSPASPDEYIRAMENVADDYSGQLLAQRHRAPQDNPEPSGPVDSHVAPPDRRAAPRRADEPSEQVTRTGAVAPADMGHRAQAARPSPPDAGQNLDRYGRPIRQPLPTGAVRKAPAGLADRTDNDRTATRPNIERESFNKNSSAVADASESKIDRYGRPVAGQATTADASRAAQPATQLASVDRRPRLPQGNPPLGLDGYCPVTLTDHEIWQVGDTRWGVIHRRRTYLFAGPEEQQRFLANPDHFSPVISGNDPVLALDRSQTIPGRRDFGVFYEGRIYLFASEESLNRFSVNPQRYSSDILQAQRQTTSSQQKRR